MNTYQRELDQLMSASAASGNSNVIKLGKDTGITVTIKHTGAGNPNFQLQATNDPAKTYWANVGATVTKAGTFLLGHTQPNFLFYRINHSGGDAGDAIVYHLHRWRSF